MKIPTANNKLLRVILPKNEAGSVNLGLQRMTKKLNIVVRVTDKVLDKAYMVSGHVFKTTCLFHLHAALYQKSVRL